MATSKKNAEVNDGHKLLIVVDDGVTTWFEKRVSGLVLCGQIECGDIEPDQQLTVVIDANNPPPVLAADVLQLRERAACDLKATVDFIKINGIEAYRAAVAAETPTKDTQVELEPGEKSGREAIVEIIDHLKAKGDTLTENEATGLRHLKLAVTALDAAGL